MMNESLEKKHLEAHPSFAFHPYNILLLLSIIGLSALFLSLSAAFVYNRVQNNLPPIRLPNIFILNTLVLMGSSGAMWWAKKAYLADNTRAYQRALSATVLLSLIFMIAQYFGWSRLFQQNIFIQSNNSASYLYLISGLHFLHVVAGLPFLGVFLWTAYKRMKEPVSVLIYFSDPEKRLKLRLLTVYWHFLDALWIYLALFFWINYFVQ